MTGIYPVSLFPRALVFVETRDLCFMHGCTLNPRHVQIEPQTKPSTSNCRATVLISYTYSVHNVGARTINPTYILVVQVTWHVFLLLTVLASKSSLPPALHLLLFKASSHLQRRCTSSMRLTQAPQYGPPSPCLSLFAVPHAV